MTELSGAAPEKRFRIRVVQEEGYRFRTDFDTEGELVMDEPAPLGTGTAPNAVRVLAAAVGDCLSASLLMCLTRSRVPVEGIETEVDAELVRNEAGRLRVGKLTVRLSPGVAAEDRARMQRCLGLFEDYCVVTQSVREGIDVEVEVVAAEGVGAG